MASRLPRGLPNPLLSSSRVFATTAPRPYPRLARTLQPLDATRPRYKHSIPRPPQQPLAQPSTPSESSNGSSESSSPTGEKTRKQLEPHYQLTFTCVPCSGRSSHTVSKQGYHHGSVLITCPSCRNRHIISDHLGIFGDRKITVEDLMRERGRLVKRGTLGEDGDVEFWEDETRDPSAQEITNTTPSSPLGAGSTRPSIDSTSHPRPVPSTRREYSSQFPLRRVPVDNTPRLNTQFDDDGLATLQYILRGDAQSSGDVQGSEDAQGREAPQREFSTFKPPWKLRQHTTLHKPLGRVEPIVAEPESNIITRTGLRITKVVARRPQGKVLQELKKKAAKYYGWVGPGPKDIRPNEVFAQSIAAGKRTPISRLSKDEAESYIQSRIRKDAFPSSGFNLFTKVFPKEKDIPRELDVFEAKLASHRDLDGRERGPRQAPRDPDSSPFRVSTWEKWKSNSDLTDLPPVPRTQEISQSSQRLANQIQRAAAAPSPSASRPTAAPPQREVDAPTPTPTATPEPGNRPIWANSLRTEPNAANLDPSQESSDARATPANANAKAGEEGGSKYSSSSSSSSSRPVVVRRVMPTLPDRSRVPPWERRAIFGPSTVDKPATKRAFDVWGDEALSADLRLMIELGTPKPADAGEKDSGTD